MRERERESEGERERGREKRLKKQYVLSEVRLYKRERETGREEQR